MIGTLCDALEDEYGVLVTRLYRVFKPSRGQYFSTCNQQFISLTPSLHLSPMYLTLLDVSGLWKVVWSSEYTARMCIYFSVCVVVTGCRRFIWLSTQIFPMLSLIGECLKYVIIFKLLWRDTNIYTYVLYVSQAGDPPPCAMAQVPVGYQLKHTNHSLQSTKLQNEQQLLPF